MKRSVRLEIVKGPATGKIFSQVLDVGQTMTIGRAKSCDIWLPKSDVSRNHCALSNHDGAIELTDHASNPTRLNGTQFDGTRTVNDDDMLTIGQFHLHLSIHAEGALLFGALPTEERDDFAEMLIGNETLSLGPADVDATGMFPAVISPHRDKVYSGHRVCHPLGQGSTCEVYKATRERDGAVRALKILRSGFPASEEESERFAREIQLMRKWHHPHIMRIYDNGVVLGQQFVICELLKGRTLATVLRQRTKLSCKMTLEIASQLVDGLDHAAGHGIYHRDLNPRNIFLDTDGERPHCKLIDFGIGPPNARAQLSGDSVNLGRAGYRAPELRGRQDLVDLRSDIYGLGAVVFRCLAGHPPQLPQPNGRTDAAVPSLALSAADAAPGLVDLVDRCLRRDPTKRLQRYRDLQTALSSLRP